MINTADIACAVQEAIIDVLTHKARRLAQTGLNRLVVAGGVGVVNRLLRNRLNGISQMAAPCFTLTRIL
jgi:N6-L-threonylcarbamoyladenine synthase